MLKWIEDQRTLYERAYLIMLFLLDFSVMYWNFCLLIFIYFLISCRQIVAIIQPLSQLSQSAVPWSQGSLLGSLPLPGSSSGNQQANLLFWLLLANSLQVCIHRDANLWRSKIWRLYLLLNVNKPPPHKSIQSPNFDSHWNGLGHYNVVLHEVCTIKIRIHQCTK